MTPCDACGDPTDNAPVEVDEVTSGFTVCMVQCQGPCGVLA